MTNPVIDKIQRSLERSERTLLSQRPAIDEPRQAGSTDSEIQLFLDEIKKLSGVGQRLAPNGIADALRALVAEYNIRKATCWHTPLIEQYGLDATLRNLGVDLISPNADKHEMALCDLGITEADYLLPETGTLVLRSTAEKPRAVSLLPSIHLAIVRPDMLRPDMQQVFTEAKDSSYLVFVTGPSRTADIELTTTLGVHGPKRLYVWILDN